MSRRLASAGLAACVVWLTACGERHEARSGPAPRIYAVSLDSAPGPEHAGLYEAIAGGEFARVSLDVRPTAPAGGSSSLGELAAGRADAAVTTEAALLEARDGGTDVLAVGALVQRPLAALIALGGRGVTSVQSLAGRRVATTGTALDKAELDTALLGANVSPARVRMVPGGPDLVKTLVSGHADAALGGRWNREGLALALAHRNPVVIPVDRAGVPTYDELVVVVRRADAQRRGAAIRAFLGALARGEQATRSDPSAASTALVAANMHLDRRLALGALHRSVTAYFPSDAARPFGYMDAREWDAFGRWMFQQRLLTRPPSATLSVTNEFLPGQGI